MTTLPNKLTGASVPQPLQQVSPPFTIFLLYLVPSPGPFLNPAVIDFDIMGLKKSIWKQAREAELCKNMLDQPACPKS